jgi:nitrous oxide reductase accessory protein NosL
MNRGIVAVFTVMLLVVLLGSLLAACGRAEDETAAPTPEQEEAAPGTLDGKALVEERCTECHDLGRVERAMKAEEEWKATVERMVGKGARLNEAEQEVVVQYLAEAYPE